MTQQEAKKIEYQLTEMFKIRYPDIKSHVDLIPGTDEINISFFWNGISKEKWNNAKSFRMKSEVYSKRLKMEIIPFFM